MMINEQLDSRYAAGGGQPLPGTGEEGEAGGKKKSKKGGSGKSSKSKQTAEEKVEEGNEGGDSVSVMSEDPPDNPFHKNNTVPDAIASVMSHNRALVPVDPEDRSNEDVGEVWTVSRPPGLIRDGGNDHGNFYVPSPRSSEGAHFKAFLNNQKYSTHSAPCSDWKGWMRDNPRATLIHFSDVPREALEKGQHLLAVRPGSAFFSQSQLTIAPEEQWEDSGSYAQMFFHPTKGDENFGSVGSPDPEGSVVSDQHRAFQEHVRRSRGAGQGGGAGNNYQDPDSVSFLRKGFNQNIVAGIVAFTGPGLFNAMQGLGNAGGSDPKVAATMNATLYATFSIFGVLSGSLFNILGTKLLMSFGALTYGFYAISVYLWGQVDDSYAAMAIVASAFLGLGAACLWGAQGTMTLSYALENQKGLFFGIFWLIFNMGGVMGGFISMGINSGASAGASAVTPETYFTFCGLMVGGSIFAFFFVIRPSQVVKADGCLVVFEQTDSAEGLGELREVAKLFCNRYMLLLTPLIIQSNWFYAYEFGGINGLLFDAPTRGLNSAIYWGISGVSSYVCGTYYLDRESMGGRRQRAIRGLTMISAINVGQWIFAIAYQFGTGYDKGNQPDPLINFTDGATYAAPMILFMYCGLADSLVQTYAYWIIGAISNSPKTLSRYVGYYKGIQSFGACLAWIIEAEGASYKAQLLICASLAVIFIPPTYMVAQSIQDKGSTGVRDASADNENRSPRKDRYGNVSYSNSRDFAENTQGAMM
eukprot:CAMPEP_0181121678 /NCGR_PEP_ID=MMETSP1071-20121207/24875_1 /TAXON_ID=35127 /ORGANISM="Thalassiosira sp., Strain NH16" /LENGTH=755 /DNA_ID=CAMNT_0023206531 /DNA_START=28 /DNA_END=2295 /DNA_ORIENTATION=-